jgi:NitT/TauT family transport system ATP-binding protein
VKFGTGSEQVTALENVSFSVPSRSFLTVVGPSGCGKTTLLKVLSGVLKPSSGSVKFDGALINRERIVGQIGYVFQRPLLLPWRTALENVMLTMEIARKDMTPIERRAEAYHWLSITGLNGFENRYAHELSGGMQQRVSISRALAFRPKVLLMDEPFAALDEITRETLQEELLRLWAQIDTTVVFITHSIPEAVLLSEQILIMSARPGRIIDRIDVPFSRQRSDDTRELRQFSELTNHIRHQLRPAKRNENSESSP